MTETSVPRAKIHVVAGLLSEYGQICITRRPQDAHQGGKWELPGGKREAGETPRAALARELREELGIAVTVAEPFAQVRHAYSDIEVLLDVWRVIGYEGVPRGCEAQELVWAEIDALDPAEFPEADRPILRRLQLPPLYLLSDVQRQGRVEFASRLVRAVRAGARLIQLREPWMARSEFTGYARELSARCRDFGARLLINADPAWTEECGADGVHLNSKRLMALSARPLGSNNWVSASCHNDAELHKAQALGLDFVVLGPVRPTPSHAGAATIGWEHFAVLCASVSLPVYAIGGMQAGDLETSRSKGAQGLAMISGVWGSVDFESEVRSLTSPKG